MATRARTTAFARLQTRKENAMRGRLTTRPALTGRLLAGAALLGLLGVAACEREGPAERAGQSIDRAGQNVHDTLNPPSGPAAAVGRKIDRATGND
jgi:hypothetical protein